MSRNTSFTKENKVNDSNSQKTQAAEITGRKVRVFGKAKEMLLLKVSDVKNVLYLCKFQEAVDPVLLQNNLVSHFRKVRILTQSTITFCRHRHNLVLVKRAQKSC